MDTVVRLDGVVRQFEDVRAVDGVSLLVHPGEILGILGHNGAGKTTLLRLVNGLLRPDGGVVRVFGLDPCADGDRVRARTGVLTEYPALDPFLSCAENLHVHALIHGLSSPDAARAISRTLDVLGVLDRAGTPAQELSAGLKQRVALGRALVHDPDLLLLDEPTSNLDPMAGRAVRDLVGGLAREHGRTVVLATHNLAEAQSMCDRIAIVRRGRLLACGTVEELGRHIAGTTVVVTVDRADVARATETLTKMLGTQPTRLADGVSLEVSVDGVGVPDVVAALAARPVRVEAVVPQRPTLEDIYVDFHEPSAPMARAPTGRP